MQEPQWGAVLYALVSSRRMNVDLRRRQPARARGRRQAGEIGHNFVLVPGERETSGAVATLTTNRPGRHRRG